MPSFTDLLVTSTETLTPGMVRVRFRAVDPDAFAAAFGPSAFTDRYVKLALGTAEVPVLRTYTALEPDLDAATLAIDFVVHGDEGYAGPWAAAAAPGDRLSVRGPGGAYAPDPAADFHLFAADEAGLPATRAALAALAADAPDAVGVALLAVPGDEHRQPVTAPASVEVRWVEVGSLAEHVRALAWPEGRVQAFVHGEAEEVMHGVRPYLLKERALPRDDVSISGYWRRGRTEETFREWKRELAAAEA